MSNNNTSTTTSSAKNTRAVSMSATDSNAADRREKLRQRMRDFYGLALPENNNNNNNLNVSARAVSEPMGVSQNSTKTSAQLAHA